MSKYEDYIYLRGKTKTSDIAECISKTFSDFGINFPVFQAGISKYCFKYEIDNGSIHLQMENPFLEFKFKGFINESEECISIKYNGNSRRLEYAETFSDPRFLTAFFDNCRNYYGKCLFPELRLVNRSPAEEYCSESNPVSIRTDEIRVTYYADENGSLLFPYEWMERISKDLYFLNINHRYDKGLSILDIDPEDEQCLTELCFSLGMSNFLEKISNNVIPEVPKRRLRRMNSPYGMQAKVRIDKIKEKILPSFDDEEKEKIKILFYFFCKHKKKELKENLILSPEAKIIIETQETKYEITKESFECSSYEDFCTLMINEISKIRKTKIGATKTENTKFVFCEYDDDYQLENKKLKNALQKTKADLENLRKQHAELFDELKNLKCQTPSADTSSATTNAEHSVVINNLKTENHVLKEKNKRLEQDLNDINTKNESCTDDFINLLIPCTKKNLFKNEIEDYCYKILYSGFEYEKLNLPQNKADENTRKTDVVLDILEHRKFTWENTETFKQLSDIEIILKSAREPCLQDLCKYGFVSKQGCRKHPKYYFYNERYQMTFSNTPSDINTPKSKMREIKARCFLVPTKQVYNRGQKMKQANSHKKTLLELC